MLRNKSYLYGDELLKVPAHLNYGRYMIELLKNHEDTIAVINGESGETLTYKEFLQEAIDVALSLVRLGVKRGDAVGVCSEKRINFLATVLGVICAGAVAVPTDVSGGRANLLHRLRLAHPKVMICSPYAYDTHINTFREIEGLSHFIVYDEPREGATLYKDFLTEHADVEDFLPVPVGGDDMILVLYSSGTTGLPKGIPCSNRAFMIWMTQLIDMEYYKGRVVLNTREWYYTYSMSYTFSCLAAGSTVVFCPRNDEQRFLEAIAKYKAGRFTIIVLANPWLLGNSRLALNTREWYYTYGMSYTFSCLAAGSTVVFCPRNDEQRFLEAIAKYKVQIMQLAPATLTELVKSSMISRFDVSSMELVVSASTPCSKELILAGKEKFPNLKRVCQVYGMSEAGGVASDQLAPKGPKFGSVGIPGAGFILKLVDLETRKTLGPHQRGEICLQSLTLMSGYINTPPGSHLDDEGFFATGDIAYYDEDGYIYIVDRIKELIKFNSFQVAPAELESVLEQHPSIREAGVVGAPHSQYGEAPTAFVVLQPGAGATADEIVAYVDSQVSHRMRLAGGVRFLPELPRGANAKLDRKALKQLL